MSDDAEERREEREQAGIDDGAALDEGGVAGEEEISLEDQLSASAERIEAEENRRGAKFEDTLTSAFERSQSQLSNLIDPDLLFSRASDVVGARGRQGVEAIRQSLSGRGLSSQSGASQGLLSRLMFSQQGQVTGAQRDVAIENQRQRQINAGIEFAQATQVGLAQNRQVSGAVHDTIGQRIEHNIAREGIAKGVSAQRAASRDNKMGSLGGGLLGLAGSVFGK